jgi:hypothetical protein
MGDAELMAGVDYEKSRAFGRAAASVVGNLPVDDFTDPRYYPPRHASREEVAAYFLVMVAMDHRLSRPGKPYEGLVDGEFFHGADLLYRLGRKMLEEDPGFFTAERLARVTSREVRSWLTVEDPRGRLVAPPDPELRALLLRDLGEKLLTLYNGSAFELIARSKGFLKRDGSGFIDRLKVFIAFQDPVEKKPYLLAKFLERRGVLEVRDPHNKEVPVDNHLTRIAIRLGMVIVDEETREAIASRRPFTWEEDALIRLAARVAYKEASRAGGVDPFILDDYLWLFGRRCCTRDSPSCLAGCRDACRRLGGCSSGTCIFRPICLAARDPLYMLPEHEYIETWYY